MMDSISFFTMIQFIGAVKVQPIRFFGLVVYKYMPYSVLGPSGVPVVFRIVSSLWLDYDSSAFCNQHQLVLKISLFM